MKGFMRQRGDSWGCGCLGRDPVTGKQRDATRTVRGGKRAAQRVLAEMVPEAERCLLVRTNATAGETIEAWFERATRVSSPRP
jgi:integrase